MFCSSAQCFFINVSFRAIVSALWAFLSSRHSSALYCFYSIVSVLMNKIFVHYANVPSQRRWAVQPGRLWLHCADTRSKAAEDGRRCGALDRNLKKDSCLFIHYFYPLLAYNTEEGQKLDRLRNPTRLYSFYLSYEYSKRFVRQTFRTTGCTMGCTTGSKVYADLKKPRLLTNNRP